ncbi:MAG: beta-lactamase family protein [Defluviitaleaceae bacterium]|nr:beta-lactamase family protein [Defluviitaleaceae bacterium]
MRNSIQNIYNAWCDDKEFSGVFSVTGPDGVIFQQAGGYRNKAEKLPNEVDTAFGIASGTKLFTGLAVCKLIGEGKLSPEDKLWDLLPYDLGQIDKRVTVHHLLTHTSGVGDYIDEEAEDSEEQLAALNNKYPCYLWKRLEYYLQMITHLPPKFEPGVRYGYSNAGYILLGLAVEAVSDMPYQQFVQENIITPCELQRTGFYPMDSLPGNTAFGYICDETTKEWRTNIFDMPIIGGSDGGLFTCAQDLDKLWRAIFANEILSENMTQTFLKQHVVMDEEDGESYGLGVYSLVDGDKGVYYAVGGDAGVAFFTAYFPQTKTVASALANTNTGIYSLISDLFDVLG